MPDLSLPTPVSDAVRMVWIRLVQRLAMAWRKFARPRWLPRRHAAHPLPPQPRLLVVGIYLANKPNTVAHLVQVFGAAAHCSVTQRWVALNGEPPTTEVERVTVARLDGRVPKFELLNRLVTMADVEAFDYILVSDDDVSVQPDFMDRFLGWQAHCGFALAQPARSWASHVDHAFVRRSRFTLARETRFVEIGPVFCMRQDIARLLLPFDTSSPMGWGYDMVWPVVARRHGLTLGIVDDAPVQHSLRPRGAAYEVSPELQAMGEYLSRHEHLSAEQAFTVVRRFRRRPVAATRAEQVRP